MKCEYCGGSGECETELYEGLVTCPVCKGTGIEETEMATSRQVSNRRTEQHQPRSKPVKVKIEINCDNAAFESPELEVGRILRELADRVEVNGLDEVPLRDYNGNRVGQLSVIDD